MSHFFHRGRQCGAAAPSATRIFGPQVAVLCPKSPDDRRKTGKSRPYQAVAAVAPPPINKMEMRIVGVPGDPNDVLIVSGADRYREKAEECRAAAASMTTSEQSQYYLELASMWDVLAADVDIRADFLRRNPPPRRW